MLNESQHPKITKKLWRSTISNSFSIANNTNNQLATSKTRTNALAVIFITSFLIIKYKWKNASRIAKKRIISKFLIAITIKIITINAAIAILIVIKTITDNRITIIANSFCLISN